MKVPTDAQHGSKVQQDNGKRHWQRVNIQDQVGGDRGEAQDSGESAQKGGSGGARTWIDLGLRA